MYKLLINGKELTSVKGNHISAFWDFYKSEELTTDEQKALIYGKNDATKLVGDVEGYMGMSQQSWYDLLKKAEKEFTEDEAHRWFERMGVFATINLN